MLLETTLAERAPERWSDRELVCLQVIKLGKRLALYIEREINKIDAMNT